MGGWQTKFNVSPGPGLWPSVLGPFGPDLGPDLDPTWDLDLSLTKSFLVSSEWQSKFSVWPRSRSLSLDLSLTKSESLPWLGEFNTFNQSHCTGWGYLKVYISAVSLPWLEVFKYVYQYQFHSTG